MENAEKVVHNENNEAKQKKPYKNRMRKRFYSNKNRTNTNVVKEKAENENSVATEVVQKAPKTHNIEKKPQQTATVAREVKNAPKPQKKPVQKEMQKDTEPIDFVIGEFEDKGKKYAFKMIKRVYYIYEVAEESEKELFKTADSKEAYNEWCKIKYPEKLKKGMM